MLKTELRIFTIKIAVEMIENDMLRDNRRRMRAIKNKKITNKPKKKMSLVDKSFQRIAHHQLILSSILQFILMVGNQVFMTL